MSPEVLAGHETESAFADRRVVAVIPAWREEGSVGPVVRALREQGIEVLVVDDCSPDGTGRASEVAGAAVVRHPFNLGYGGALQTGYILALERGAEVILQLDADGQHDPASAAGLIGPILAGEADLVIGSRFLDAASYRVPAARRAGQKLFGAIVRLITGLTITDPTSGYQAMTPAVARFFRDPVFPMDYPDADVLIMLHRMGFRITERPARMHAGHGGSMHGGIVRPVYYVYKMLLSIFMACIRDLRPGRPL